MSLQAFLLSLLRWPDGVVVKVGRELRTQAGSGGSLAGLSDVVLTSPTDGQVLTYDTALGKWINETPTGGGGGGGGSGDVFVEVTTYVLELVPLTGDDADAFTLLNYV